MKESWLVPGKHLLPLAAMMAGVLSFSAAPAHATEIPEGAITATQGDGGTPDACPYHLFARGLDAAHELRFTVREHPRGQHVVAQGTFGIGENGEGRSPAEGEHTLPNGTYEARLTAAHEDKGHGKDHGKDHGNTGHHRSEQRKGEEERDADAARPAEQAAEPVAFRPASEKGRARVVFTLKCAKPAPGHGTQGTQEPTVPAAPEQEQEVAEEQQTEGAAPERQEQEPAARSEQAQPEHGLNQLPFTGVNTTKLFGGALGLLLIGAFLLFTTRLRGKA